MWIPIECPNCKEKDFVFDTALGKKGQCNACGHIFLIRQAVGTASDGSLELKPIECPSCGEKDFVPDAAVGRKGRCNACGYIFFIRQIIGTADSVSQKLTPDEETDGTEPQTRSSPDAPQSTNAEIASTVGQSNEAVPIYNVNRGTAVPSVDPEDKSSVGCRCVVCNLNLVGLRSNQNCPKCGTPIVRSAIGGNLDFCDPNWLQTLSNGTIWAMIGLSIMLLSAIVFVLNDIVAPIFPIVNHDSVRASVFAVIGAIWLCAIFLCTQDEPFIEEKYEKHTWYIWAKAAAIVRLLGSFGYLTWSIVGDGNDIFGQTIVALCLSADLLLFYGLFLRYRELAERMNDEGLVSKCSWTIPCFVIAYLASLAFHASNLVTMYVGMGDADWEISLVNGISCLGFVTGFAVYGLALWSGIMLAVYYVGIRHARDFAMDRYESRRR